VEVTDGDTIVVRLRGGDIERVRYIGVDTPESTPDQPLECFGHEATERNRDLVTGQPLRLELGPERRDDYGRLLAYVRTRDAFVNARLLEGGYARTLAIAPNDKRAPSFARIEARAGRRGLGLWGSCAKPSANLSGP
jgi:micrococcal nuclease